MNRNLSQEQILATLTTEVFGRSLVILPRTGSTNGVAKALAEKGAAAGTVVVTDEQTAGRGRMGRRWLAPARTCILCSILFRPDLLVNQAQRLTMLCALAAADAVEAVAGLSVWLKWPNDLVVKSPIPDPQSPIPKLQSSRWRKLAGLLTETGVTENRLEFVVVGIGINVNVPPEVLPTLAADATSILAEVGRQVDRAVLLAALLAGVERRYDALRAGGSPHREWVTRLATLGQPVEATTPAGTIAGAAESVDEDGALLLRTPDGVLHRLLSGDVTLTHT